MDGHDPSGFHAPINHPQPAQGIAPTQPATLPPKLPWYKTILHAALANKSFSLFVVMMILSAGMGTYIIVAPSSETKERPRPTAFSQVIPTAYPTTPPTQIPTPTQLPIPEPTEEIEATPTEEPTPTMTPTPTPDPTANWNTYINTEYGYTIKYPLNWTALNLGVLEPKVPSYVVFNENTATTSARSITVSVSTRGYQEQLTINGTKGSPFYIASTLGTWQNLKNSDGESSIAVTLPRTGTILIIRAKTTFVTTFNQMLSTLFLSN